MIEEVLRETVVEEQHAEGDTQTVRGEDPEACMETSAEIEMPPPNMPTG